MNPKISIIILNWNGVKITEQCINSIKKQTFKDYEIIVVDNASTDGSISYLKNKFPKIKFIHNKQNLGYAGGNNVGIKKTKGEWVLILNNDTILDKNFLDELWKNRGKADILGVRNYYFNERNIIWAIGSKVNKLTMRAKLIANKMKDSSRINSMKIEHAVGSAIFVNKKVFSKIGYLNEDYFAYYEETEWQARAKKANLSISWVPSAKLWHKVACSTGGGKSPLSAYYLIRNRGYFIKKWGEVKIIAWPAWLSEGLLRTFYGLLKDKEYAKMTLKGMRDFFKGKKGK